MLSPTDVIIQALLIKACTPFVKVENGHLTIKFDEISMLLFGHEVPGISLDI